MMERQFSVSAENNKPMLIARFNATIQMDPVVRLDPIVPIDKKSYQWTHSLDWPYTRSVQTSTDSETHPMLTKDPKT